MRSPIIPCVAATLLAALSLMGCGGAPADDAPTEEVEVRDFLAMTTDGIEISGESLLGHVTIVDFWAVY